MTIEQVLKKFKANRPSENTQLIKKAYEFAKHAHQGQVRLNGETRLEHLLSTADKLAEFKMDAITLAAGLLHDVTEYTPVTLKELEKNFGSEIAFLVKNISDTEEIKRKIKNQDQKERERQIENLRKIFLAMAKDIRVVLIKLADRLHNMRTLYALPKEKRERIAQETLDIYAPLAHRLGIGNLKGQLEDLAFSYVYPKEYQSLMASLPDKYENRERYLKRASAVLKDLLKKEGIKVIEVHSRAKHHYSLYKKLLHYNMDWSKIHDLVALRIIVPNVESCYAALGAAHKKWKPLPGRIKDYIATPKPNGYRSLHTTVFCEDGRITELQFRTPQMHIEAEYGIAAHWHYDENKSLAGQLRRIILRPKEEHSQKPAPEEEISWIKQLREWQQKDFANPEEFIESLKIDFFKDRIFVFTPKGEVIDLPEGATAVDFAYSIHTDIGDRCSGAKADGKMISLADPLQNGQVVEVLTEKNKKPNQDWLKTTKTNQAKTKIKASLKKQLN